jgi:hypothetical protein
MVVNFAKPLNRNTLSNSQTVLISMKFKIEPVSSDQRRETRKAGHS